MTKQQFSRAAAICLSQLDRETGALCTQMVDLVFLMFDEKGDNKLSHEEFIGVMRDWKDKGGRVRAAESEKEGFWNCVKKEVRKSMVEHI